MDLKAAAKKPKLQKFSLDSEYVIDEYGEPLEFYMYDRYPMPTYIRLSTVQPSDTAGMLDVIRELVLDAQGTTMLDADDQLPPKVMVDMINVVVEQLGNLAGQTSQELTATQK